MLIIVTPFVTTSIITIVLLNSVLFPPDSENHFQTLSRFLALGYLAMCQGYYNLGWLTLAHAPAASKGGAVTQHGREGSGFLGDFSEALFVNPFQKIKVSDVACDQMNAIPYMAWMYGVGLSSTTRWTQVSMHPSIVADHNGRQKYYIFFYYDESLEATHHLCHAEYWLGYKDPAGESLVDV
jgi:hypothetical protein